MLPFNRPASIAFALILGMAFNVQSAIPAFSDPVPSKNATQSHTASRLHSGDLVRVRSGGPLMTVTGIQGDQVNCSWSDWNGEFKSGDFPIAVLTAPVTIPSADPSLKQDERAADSGSVSISGKFQCVF